MMAGMKLRFSIRDLLWLTLVAALVAGWWIERSRQSYTFKINADGSVDLYEKKTMRHWHKDAAGLSWSNVFPTTGNRK
jgi:hypothetical protein